MTKKRRIGLVNFRQYKDEIKEMYDKGFPIIHIFESFSDKVGVKKTQFYELMNKEIIKKNKPANIEPKVKSIQHKNQQRNNIDYKSDNTDPFRQKRKPIHNPTMTDERRKELF